MQPFTFFISYRRADTAPIALLLKYEIEKRMQFVRAFVDVDSMRSGDVFPDRLRNLIKDAHATIALVGPEWMSRKEGSREARPEDDWVIRELAFSVSTPLAMAESDRYSLRDRVILPLFVNCPPSFNQFVIPETISYIQDRHAEHIAYANWPTSIGPLIDRIAVRLELKKRPDADEYPKPDPAKARTQPLPDVELAKMLNYDDYEGWYVDNFGNAEARYLVKTFKFPHFNQAADFMKLVSDHCRVQDHHPEWRNVFNHVTVALTTWDARRRVTFYDLSLALYMNMASKAVLKPK
ncbi:4a-hydroxytetrahydrobiopterin dehydratase [Bradyrhizobium sp.]|jgi:pterin-4a-carbinolamine dehydratase|uniref:4a-hydroxytetrahydrobiopterin dehydratase n=1 Tax=Bradyrhizobium sp. TaxID=376 RepID=UPI002E029DB0|nr:4a-hydroxytetrahydrobiopterin dehydratase [Bradyrhizobium sp.]